MTRLLRPLSLALLAASLPGAALAQQVETLDGREVITAKVTEIRFDTANVNATADGPDLKLIGGRTAASYPPLIRPRTDFNAELSASVAAVR